MGDVGALSEEMERDYLFWTCVDKVKSIDEVEKWSIPDMEKYLAFKDMQSDLSDAYEEATRPKDS